MDWNKNLNRRDFIRLIGKSLLGLSGFLGLAGLVRFLSYQPDPPPQALFDLGPAGGYPPGSRTPVAGGQAVLLATEGGYQALSLLCPHLGCVLELEPQGYACPCHGSRFYLDGSLENGPASLPMKPLKVEQSEDGRLILSTRG